MASSAGEPFDACPRQVLKRAVARLAEQRMTLHVGIEPEFFLLKHEGGRWMPADDADRLDKPSYDLQSIWPPTALPARAARGA